MRLLATAAALACALLALPAPAAGADRGPFDFELAPRADAVASAAAGRAVVSRRLGTSRFNLLGMRWRGAARPEIELRVRRPGGRWSRWHELEQSHARGASDPLWVGSATGVQYRLSRAVRGLRLHFVNVAGFRRRAQRVARAAQDPQPEVVSRAGWGAGQCPPRRSPGYGSVKAVHVHHTVSMNDYAPEDGPAIVLAICRFHRNSNGWDDIGYNALVDKYGVLYEGRAGGLDQPVIGAQAQGFNAETAGIASIADHTGVEATPETLDALSRYIRWKLQVHGQPLSGKVTLRSSGGSATRYPAGTRVSKDRVIGHRDTGRTACPGDLLYARLDDLRAMVASGVTTVPSFATRLSAALADYRVDFGDVVPVTGVLSGPDGAPLAGEQVDLQLNSDNRWRRTRRLITAPDGSFATELKPRKRMYVRLRYRGNGDLRSAFSSRLLLRLRPLVELRRPAARAVAGSRVPLRGRVRPRKRIVHLVLQQHIRGRYRRVGVKAIRARRGRFRSSFVPAFRDRYRYRVVARPDEDTDRGASPWQLLRVR